MKELKATLSAEGGPTAKVGWMDARWFRWWPAGKPQKIELIKFDQRGQAFIESKGDQATKYSGEPATEVVRFFGMMK